MTTQNTPSPLGTPSTFSVSELVAIKLDVYGHETRHVVATFDTDEQARAYIHATEITPPTRGRALPRCSFKKGSLLEGARHAGVGVLWAANRPDGVSVPHNPTA